MTELARGGVIPRLERRRRVWAETEGYTECYIPLPLNPEQIARNVRMINEYRNRRDENTEEV